MIIILECLNACLLSVVAFITQSIMCFYELMCGLFTSFHKVKANMLIRLRYANVIDKCIVILYTINKPQHRAHKKQSLTPHFSRFISLCVFRSTQLA